MSVGDDYVELGANASDVQDGNLSSQVLITGDVDTSVGGDYIIRYSVTDSNENNAIEKTELLELATVLLAIYHVGH